MFSLTLTQLQCTFLISVFSEMVILALINEARLIFIVAIAMRKDLARLALGLMPMRSRMLPLV